MKEVTKISAKAMMVALAAVALNAEGMKFDPSKATKKSSTVLKEHVPVTEKADWEKAKKEIADRERKQKEQEKQKQKELEKQKEQKEDLKNWMSKDDQI